MLAAAGAYVAFGVGKHQADYLLYPAGICAIALVAICMLCVAAGALRVWLFVKARPAGIPHELETTHASSTDFAFPSLAWWPLVETRVAWVSPTGIDVALEPRGNLWTEVITARQRGRYTRLVRRFTAGHPGIPVVEVPASGGDIHDLDGLRTMGSALTAR